MSYYKILDNILISVDKKNKRKPGIKIPSSFSIIECEMLQKVSRKRGKNNKVNVMK